MRIGFDPRICPILFDANAFNRDGGLGDVQVDRLLELGQSKTINLVTPGTVRAEVLNPRTPQHVQDAILPQIFTLPVGLNSDEQRRLQTIKRILQGNAGPGKHDADAWHIFLAAKHGGYFITHDERINRTKRLELEAALPPSIKVVTLAEFLEIFDHFDAGGTR